MKKYILITLFLVSNFLTFNFVNAGESTAHFVRASDIKTVGQGVKLYIGKEYIGKVWTNNYAVARTETGKRKITTKVGLSIGVPVTGLGGAKKFKSKFVFTDDEHYFKIKFNSETLDKSWVLSIISTLITIILFVLGIKAFKKENQNFEG